MRFLTLRRCFSIALLLGLVAFPAMRASAADAATNAGAVRGLIESRLAVMKDVAAFKHLRGVAVQDLGREAVVLKKAVEGAAAKGLVPETVTPFFRAQIEAAKAIQRCWIARWTEGDTAAPTRAPDLKTEVRPKLVEIGGQLVAAIAETPATAMPIETCSRTAKMAATDSKNGSATTCNQLVKFSSAGMRLGAGRLEPADGGLEVRIWAG